MNRFVQNKRWIAYLLVAVFAVLSLSCLSELVRKNDQVAILSGAIDLSRGHVQPWANYYQYDKCYVLYWLLAGVFKLIPAVSPVLAGNAFVCLFFWAALWFFVRRQPRVNWVAVLAFCSAPAVLFNTVYVNSSVFASAFLLMAVTLLPMRSRWALAGAGLALFAATGSRIDIALILPFLAWSFMPAPFFGTRMLRWKKLWVFLLFPVVALGLGLIQRDTATVMTDPFFNVKVLGGYTVFGFGGMCLLYLCAVAFLLRLVFRGRGRGVRLFYAGGAVSLLLPVLFYVGQLHTPRYFFRACEVTLIFLCSRRGRLLWHAFFFRKPVAVLVCAACLLPMVLGLDLSHLSRPRPVVSKATGFPSGDGYYPMGAYLDFMIRLKRAPETPIDHNQEIWEAVQSAELDFSAGPVPVLWSPMYGYFMLRASLANGVAECRGLSHWAGTPFYAETRTWMRQDPKFLQAGLDNLLGMPSAPVSRDLNGVEVRRFGAGNHVWAERTRFLNQLFEGDEYRIYDLEEVGAGQRGRVLLYSMSEEALRNVLPADGELARSGLFFYGWLDARSLGEMVRSSEVMVGVRVLPLWMSVKGFKGDSDQR